MSGGGPPFSVVEPGLLIQLFESVGGKAGERLCPAFLGGPQGGPDTAGGAAGRWTGKKCRTGRQRCRPSPRCSGEVRTQCHSAGALCPQEGTRRGAGAKPTCPSLPCEQSCSRQTPGSRRHLGNACCKAGVKDMPEERPAHPHSHRSHSHCCPDTHTEDGAARDCGGRCGCFEDTPRGNSEGHSGGARPPSCRRETQSRNQRVWCQTVRAERPLQGVAPSSQEEGQGLHRAHSQVHGPPPTGGQSQGLATAVPGEAGQLAVLCRVPAAAPRPVLAGPAHVSRTGQPSRCLK